MVEIVAYISALQVNRAGDRSEKIRIAADYESASIMGSITFEVPIDQALKYYVGQKISIRIE